MFRYFSIRNSKITVERPFYILSPTQLIPVRLSRPELVAPHLKSALDEQLQSWFARSISGATSVSCFTSETSVSGIEPETCSQSFGHQTKALALSFWIYSFRWVPNHQDPEKYLDKIHWCWDSNPGRLNSRLTLYPLSHHAPNMKNISNNR